MARSITFMFSMAIMIEMSYGGEWILKRSEVCGLEMKCKIEKNSIDIGEKIKVKVMLKNISKEEMYLPCLSYISEKNKRNNIQIDVEKRNRGNANENILNIFSVKLNYIKPFLTKKKYFCGAGGGGVKLEYYSPKELIIFGPGSEITVHVKATPVMVGEVKFIVMYKVYTDIVKRYSEKTMKREKAREEKIWKGNFISTNLKINIVLPIESEMLEKEKRIIDTLMSLSCSEREKHDLIEGMENNELTAKLLAMIQEKMENQPGIQDVLTKKQYELIESGIDYHSYYKMFGLALNKEERIERRKKGIMVAGLILSKERKEIPEEIREFTTAAKIDFNENGNVFTVGIPKNIVEKAREVIEICSRSENIEIAEMASEYLKQK